MSSYELVDALAESCRERDSELNQLSLHHKLTYASACVVDLKRKGAKTFPEKIDTRRPFGAVMLETWKMYERLTNGSEAALSAWKLQLAMESLLGVKLEKDKNEEGKKDMSKTLQLVKTGDFEGIKFDCYQDSGKEFWGTREQIGTMLGYEEPGKAIAKIHERNAARFKAFSTVVKLTKVEGGREVSRAITVYNFKGLLEICRYSNQPKANAVIDFLWEMADEVRKTGSYNVKGKDRENPDDTQRLELARQRLEIQKRNADARMAKIMQRMVESPAYALTQESKQILAHEITHLATGREHAAMLPDAGTRFYTAKQVGDAAGVSNRRVMKTAREMGLVAPEGGSNEYGRWKMSKSPHSPHECAQWAFSHTGREKVLRALSAAA